MAGSVNKVILVGNLGRDPEIRTMQQSGGRMASFSVATSESWKDKTSGERKEKTEWHRVSVFNENLVNVIERYVKKGSKVYIEGQLETRKYTDKDGVEKYSTEVVLTRFRGELTLLDSAGSAGSSGGRSNDNQFEDYSQNGPASFSGPASGTKSMASDLDDEIPF